MRSNRYSLALGALALWSSCASDPSEHNPSDCGLSLSVWAAMAGAVPARAVVGLPAAEIRDDPEAPLGGEGIVVDPAPELRGEHPGWRARRARGSCTPTLERLPWVPAGPPPAPIERVLGDPGALPHPLIGGVVITGADPGAQRDAAAWSLAFRALRLSVPHHEAPSRAAALEAIGSLCDRLEAGATAIVVTTGPGSAARGGALVLGPEAVSWSALVGTIAARCDHLGLLVWVADASFAGAIDPSPLGTRPWLLWRASDAATPDAPRLGPAGGGALSAALSAAVRDRIAADCLARTRPRPAEVATLFDDAGMRAATLGARWEAMGVGEGPARAALAAYLAAQLPAEPLRRGAPPASAERCAEDADCAKLAESCDLPTCRALACSAGRCVPGVAAGAACDDDNSCTEGETCDAAGLCRGALVACDDGNPCTVEGCEPGVGCVALPRLDAAPCDDGDPCTAGDACDAAGACTGGPADCDDGDPCTYDQCATGVGCVSYPASLPCDDGDACTFADACVQGVCTGTLRACDDANPCTRDACDPSAGACVAVPALEGTPCDDGDPCSVADRCFGGVCGGLASACDDGLPCTWDRCDGGACEHLSVPGTCVFDGECLEVGDKPAGQACLMCAATGVVAADPEAEGAACEEDGVSCSIDRCVAGVCRHDLPTGTCATPEGGCVGVGDALTPCLVCVDTGVAAPKPPGTPCSGAGECTQGQCDGLGSCVDAPMACCPIEPIGCAEIASGPALSGPSRSAGWACAPGQAFAGPERTWRFEAPCRGLVTFTAAGAGPASVVVGGVGGDAEACRGGGCEALGASVGLAMEVGDVRLVTLEGVTGAPWGLAVQCTCFGPTTP